MRNYRLVMILKSDLKKDTKDKLFSDVKKWVGEVKKDSTTSLGEKKFAYPIKGNKKGEYILMEFEADNIAKDADMRMNIQDDILRHLLVRTN